MKVQELMNILKTLDPDSEVLLEAWHEEYIQDEHCFNPKLVELDDKYYCVDEDTGYFIISGYLDDEDEDKIDYYKRDWYKDKGNEN